MTNTEHKTQRDRVRASLLADVPDPRPPKSSAAPEPRLEWSR
jgi:hypothetical protein